jgi:hypothetical protein
MIQRRYSGIRLLAAAGLLCAAAGAAAPLVRPAATGGVARVGTALGSGSGTPSAVAAPVPARAVPPDWAPTRSPEERRKVWESIEDAAEIDLRHSITGGVGDALFSGVDTQVLSGALLGLPPKAATVEIPVGRERGATAACSKTCPRRACSTWRLRS